MSNGQVTHEFAGGGTYYFDEDRAWYVTALASYQLNQRKRGIDITRGDLVQVQGGMGVSLLTGAWTWASSASRSRKFAMTEVRTSRPCSAGRATRRTGWDPRSCSRCVRFPRGCGSATKAT